MIIGTIDITPPDALIEVPIAIQTDEPPNVQLAE
jgi:hypothetical protein